MNVVPITARARPRDEGDLAPVRIGASGAAMPAGAVLAWVEKAETGRELVYAEGSLPGWSNVGALVRDLDDRKIVFAYYEGATGHYIIRRLSEPYRPAPAKRRVSRQLEPTADDKARLLMVLRAEAKAGQPCSTNKVLAIKAGLSDGDRASYLIKLLVAEGAIQRDDNVAWAPTRKITITATGKSTFVGEARR
ncbi:hypothetical protein O4H52_03180 [Sphingomonadaceae bacterium G21617-S1]|nr:hypothetical protein [Sphingomonadaceae bacterium G21617-S1]